MSNNHRNNRKPKVSPEQQVIEAVAKGIWQVVSFLFNRNKKGIAKHGLVSAQVAQDLGQHWEVVTLYSQTPNTYAVAISEADKLLDNALKAAHFAGNTMGERLKSAQGTFDPYLYNQIWEAHKLRNRLAHDVGATVNGGDLQQSLHAFEQGLVRLGVFIH
jgi:hypothetical protein